ncbi:MAG: hypothetical protein LBH79_03240 [Nitrososphaerota archaeon]|nr:hypothetical protein [Nitrososphaerota archaeon]
MSYPYCTPKDVRKLINTDLSDDQLAAIIDDVDRDLDDRLESRVMKIDIKKLCSMRLAAVVVAQQQASLFRTDGSFLPSGNSNIREWTRFVKQKVMAAKGGRWDSVG